MNQTELAAEVENYISPSAIIMADMETTANLVKLLCQLWDERAKMVDDMRVAKEALEKTQEPEPDWDAIRYALTRLKPYEKLFEKEGER